MGGYGKTVKAATNYGVPPTIKILLQPRDHSQKAIIGGGL